MRLRGADAPGSMEAAYRIQDEVHRLFEIEGGFGPLGGHKIALTSRAVQELCGVDRPAYGAIFASVIQRSPAVLKAADFMHLGLEFELAVLIGRDVPASGAPYDRATIAPYVEACMPAFELIEDRHADYGDLDAEIDPDRSLLVRRRGARRPGHRRGARWTSRQRRSSCSGTARWSIAASPAIRWAIRSKAWPGSPTTSPPAAASMTKGEIVITGSALKTRFPEPGDEVTYRIAGLGETTVRLEA